MVKQTIIVINLTHALLPHARLLFLPHPLQRILQDRLHEPVHDAHRLLRRAPEDLIPRPHPAEPCAARDTALGVLKRRGELVCGGRGQGLELRGGVVRVGNGAVEAVDAAIEEELGGSVEREPADEVLWVRARSVHVRRYCT